MLLIANRPLFLPVNTFVPGSVACMNAKQSHIER